MSEKRKGAPGPSITIVPKKISDWARESSSIGRINSFKVGGGRPAWNGRK